MNRTLAAVAALLGLAGPAAAGDEIMREGAGERRSDLNAMEVSQDGETGARGWLIEQIAGEPTHATPIDGRVTLQQRTGDAVTAVVNLRARGPQPTAGAAIANDIRLDRRVVAERLIPETIDTPDLATRSGEEPPEPDETNEELERALRFLNLKEREQIRRSGW